MTFSEVLGRARDILASELFQIADTHVTVATVLSVAVIVLVTIWGSRLIRRGLALWFRRRGVEAEGTIQAVGRLVHYVVVFVGFGAALQTLGINLAALFAAGAVFAIGIGFAMQNIVQNFVAGVILLVERVIKPGDILRVEGDMVRVEQLGIRSTIVKTRDGLDLIVPNSTIVQSTVTNYTLHDTHYRIRITVGVTYGSDMNLVRETLEGVAQELAVKWNVRGRQQQVVLSDFGSSSVDFHIAVWINDAWQERVAVSEVRFAVWDAFKKNGIVIAFPQVDVHLDPPVTESLARLRIG
jgi:small-conductance mechanosensitive channel